MSTLLDTNILTCLSLQMHPHHVAAKSAITVLRNQGETLHVVPQNLYEFWAVATRPIIVSNGLGLSVTQAKAELVRICSLFSMLQDIPAVYIEWARLVEIHEVKGKTSHDARLVAAMTVHGVARLLSFNDRDFSRYTTISVNNPITFLPLPRL